MRYALVKSGVVHGVIEADANFVTQIAAAWDEVVELGAARCGPGWVRTQGGFDPPPPPQEPSPPEARRITQLAFLRRLTTDEEVAIEVASQDKPTGSPQERQAAARLRVGVRRLLAAQYVDLDDTEVAATLAGLEQAALLAGGRASEILSAPVRPEERP